MKLVKSLHSVLHEQCTSVIVFELHLENLYSYEIWWDPRSCCKTWVANWLPHFCLKHHPRFMEFPMILPMFSCPGKAEGPQRDQSSSEPLLGAQQKVRRSSGSAGVAGSGAMAWCEVMGPRKAVPCNKVKIKALERPAKCSTCGGHIMFCYLLLCC